MRIKIIGKIVSKELKHQFDHIGGYLLITLFLGVLYFFFLRTFFIEGLASMRGMFIMLPWLLVVFIPAITMGLIAGERDKQTLEYLTTKPISYMELIIGKIIGSASFIIFALLLTIPLPFFIAQVGNLDIGETVSSYIGAILLILALSTMGVAISSFFKNQIMAFLTAAVAILVFTIINTDIAAINLPLGVVNFFRQLSIIDAYEPLIRGVLSLREIAYFVIFITTFLGIAYLNIERTRLSKMGSVYQKVFSAIVFIAFISMLIILGVQQTAGQFGRFDLTSSQKYTLSDVTKEVLDMEGKIKIEVFASPNLPSRMQYQYKEIQNILTDYKLSGRGNVEIEYLDPRVNQARIQELQIQQTQFNTVGEDQFQVQQGYLALAIMDENESMREVIDYFPNINEIEYQITYIISQLKNPVQPTVGYASGAGERLLTENYQIVQAVLGDNFQLETIELPAIIGDDSETTTETSTDQSLELEQFDMIIIAGPTNPYTPETLEELYDYINNGGSVFYIAETININQETGLVTPNNAESGRLFEPYGLTINQDMVYDLQSRIVIPIGTVSTPYPPITIAEQFVESDQIISNAPGMILSPFSSSLSIDETWTPIYTTSNLAGVQTENYNLDPSFVYSRNNLGQKVIVAGKKTEFGGTLVAAGSTYTFEDQFMQSSQENLIFIFSAVEELTDGLGLSQIAAKGLLDSQFNFAEDEKRFAVNYIGPSISIALLGLVGATRIIRRRNLKKIYAE